MNETVEVQIKIIWDREMCLCYVLTENVDLPRNNDMTTYKIEELISFDFLNTFMWVNNERIKWAKMQKIAIKLVTILVTTLS